jgi:hypothetical protein
VTPVNFFNGSLISYALGKGQSSLRNVLCLFGTEESQQRAAQDRTDGGYANKEGE